MTELETLRTRYADVRERIARAAARSGRGAEEVTLIAVSKYAGVDDIRELLTLGHRDFGENQVQQLQQRAAMIDEWLRRQVRHGGPAAGAAPIEPVRGKNGTKATVSVAGGAGKSSAGAVVGGAAGSRGSESRGAAGGGGVGGGAKGEARGGGRGKAEHAGPVTGVAAGGTASQSAEVAASFPVMEGESLRWHMIGVLQRNKVRKAAELCRLIHGVDSLRLAEECQIAANRIDRPVDVLLQVNVSGEVSKSGCAVAAAKHLGDAIDTMINVRLRGLMTMAPHSENAEESRPVFGRLRELFEDMKRVGMPPHFNVLSMGMSGDFEVAIEEGANVVRVGSAIFGEAAAGTEGGEDQGEGE